jgi:hypothetical protein
MSQSRTVSVGPSRCLKEFAPAEGPGRQTRIVRPATVQESPAYPQFDEHQRTHNSEHANPNQPRRRIVHHQAALAPRPARPGPARPGFETIEPRTLLSVATFPVVNGDLFEKIGRRRCLVATDVVSMRVENRRSIECEQQNGNVFEKTVYGSPQLIQRGNPAPTPPPRSRRVGVVRPTRSRSNSKSD